MIQGVYPSILSLCAGFLLSQSPLPTHFEQILDLKNQVQAGEYTLNGTKLEIYFRHFQNPISLSAMVIKYLGQEFWIEGRDQSDKVRGWPNRSLKISEANGFIEIDQHVADPDGVFDTKLMLRIRDDGSNKPLFIHLQKTVTYRQVRTTWGEHHDFHGFLR